MQTVESLLQSDAPIKWLFTGDSITHGLYYTMGFRDYVQLFEERIRSEAELGRHRDVVIRTAISGWLTRNLLEDIDWNVLQFDPQVVSIMIGMNDSHLEFEDFESNYNRILDIISEKTNAAVILHTPNPLIPGLEPDREVNLPSIVDTVRRLGEERELIVVDHWAEWTRAREENPDRTHFWMSDPVHPGPYGHRAMAKLLLQELGIWEDKSKCCGSVIF